MSDYTAFANKTFTIANQSGDEITVRCLFHDDSSPSMNFNVKTGLFICFSCGAKGNIKTLERHLGQYNVEQAPDMDELLGKIKELTATNAPVEILDDKILKRYRFPTDYWTKNRGFDDDTIAMFELGYDPMANHAIIPVRNLNGQLVTVIRRNLDPDAMIRYKNGKNFPRKSTLFAGWLIAKSTTTHAVITEGPLDAVKVWSAGIPAVAQFGSSISPEQVSLLHRLGLSTITLMYDNDKAGRKATEQALNELRGQFLVSVVQYHRNDPKDPGGMSPASIKRRANNARLVM